MLSLRRFLFYTISTDLMVASIRLDYAEPALVLFITIRTDLVVTSISIDYAERSVGFS